MPNLNLLCIDHDPGTLSALRRIFRHENLNFLTAATLEEAQAKMVSGASIVISDYRLPGARSGLDFLADIRQTHPESLRILVTGYPDPDILVRAINDCGVFRFYTKPWNTEELLAGVRAARESILRAKHSPPASQLPPLEADGMKNNAKRALQDSKDLYFNRTMVLAMLEHLPTPVVAVSAWGMVALVNAAAMEILPPAASEIGIPMEKVFDSALAENISRCLVGHSAGGACFLSDGTYVRYAALLQSSAVWGCVISLEAASTRDEGVRAA